MLYKQLNIVTKYLHLARFFRHTTMLNDIQTDMVQGRELIVLINVKYMLELECVAAL